MEEKETLKLQGKSETIVEPEIKSEVEVIHHPPTASASDLMGDIIEPKAIQADAQNKMKLLLIAEPKKDHTIYSIEEVDTPRTPLTPRPPQTVTSVENAPSNLNPSKTDSAKANENQETKFEYDESIQEDKEKSEKQSNAPPNQPASESINTVDSTDGKGKIIVSSGDDSKEPIIKKIELIGSAGQQKKDSSDEKEEKDESKDNVPLPNISAEAKESSSRVKRDVEPKNDKNATNESRDDTGSVTRSSSENSNIDGNKIEGISRPDRFGKIHLNISFSLFQRNPLKKAPQA